MTRKRLVGLVTAIIFQGLILIGMYVSAAMPQWTGTEIRVSTIPVDPRSMFRGHYARLNYAFPGSRLPVGAIMTTCAMARLSMLVLIKVPRGSIS